MAIKNIKEIIKNKGYFVEQNDRKIFEEGDLQSFFGFGDKDAIEFIVYDVNDNQLPQADGNLVRYIPMTSQNINDYILIPEGTVFQQYNLPKEYFIDGIDTEVKSAIDEIIEEYKKLGVEFVEVNLE